MRVVHSVRTAMFAVLASLVTWAAFDMVTPADSRESTRRHSDRVTLKNAPMAEYSFKAAGPADEALIFTPPGFDKVGVPAVAEGTLIPMVCCSGKTGIGIQEIMNAIVDRIPPPKGDPDAPLQAPAHDDVGERMRARLVELIREHGKWVDPPVDA